MVEDVSHPQSRRTLKFLGNPFKYAGSVPLPYPPALGQHTRDVLKRVCDYDDPHIDRLLRDRVVVQGRAVDETRKAIRADPDPITPTQGAIE
jgi:hypothetical protein